MKMNFKYVSMMACVALLAGFTGCSNDGENVEVPGKTQAKYANLEISIDIPKTTRAEGNYQGTADESKVNEISVWIYDADGTSTVKHATVTSDKTVANIATTAGTKEIYVGANLPESIKAGITGAGKAGLASYVHSVSLNGLGNQTSGFAMFSQSASSITLVETNESDPTPDANKLTVKVERMVAKIVAGKNTTVNTSAVTGGSFDLTTMTYSVKQINRYIYAAKQTKDPNYGNFKYKWENGDQVLNADPEAYGLEQFDNNAPYVNVDTPADAAAWDAAACFYVPENLEDVACHGANTYASIKVKFIPSSGAAVNGSFATVTNDAGNITGFYPTVAAAETAAGTVTGSVASGLYEGGYVYYRIYPVKETNYNVIRNDYYRLKINSIKGIGNWKDTSGPDDKPKPGKPIVETDTKMDITIEVMDWVLFEEGHDLD